MIEENPTTIVEQPVEAVLREELIRGDRVLAASGSIIDQLWNKGGDTLFSEQILARIGGMVANLARQLRGFVVESSDIDASGVEMALIERLKQSENLLRHCHALAIESQVTAELQSRSRIEPVLSPLFQSLIASGDESTASAAMMALTAQARFMQTQQRMELPGAELPGDLFHEVLTILQEFALTSDPSNPMQIDENLRTDFHESRTRSTLLTRLVNGLDDGAREALCVRHSGVALFLTALAQTSNQSRDLATLSTNERQLARLALALCAGGMSPEQVAEQFIQFHPEIALPETFPSLTKESAKALLATGIGVAGG